VTHVGFVRLGYLWTLPEPPPFRKLFHFRPGKRFEIAWNGVLQTGSGHGKFQGIAMVTERVQAVNQAAREAVPSPDAIHDVGDLVMAAEHEFAAVMQACRPAVVRSAPRFAQRDRQHLQFG